MFVYPAEPYEIAMLHATFGPAVAEVTFYDHDFPREHHDAGFGLAVGYDTDGREIAAVRSGDPQWDDNELDELIEARCETVKFGLTL